MNSYSINKHIKKNIPHLNPKVQRRLYIFAGQRNKEHLLDLWWYDVSTKECGALAAAATCAPPAAGFTQRATLDPDTDEMFVLSVSLPLELSSN